VSILDQKKPIETIDKRHKRIVNNTDEVDEEPTGNQGDTDESEADTNSTKESDNQTSQKQNKDQVDKHDEHKVTEEDIIEEAKHRAYDIIEEAKETAEIEAEMIKEQAQEEGYKRGKEQADEELQNDQEQFMKEREAFEDEYKSLVNSIEPRMVGLVIDLVEKLVGYCKVEESVIAYVIRKGFEELELTGHIAIKISEADYDSVLRQQGEIFKNMSTRATTEVLIDYTLSQGDCVIETDLGNINCSLDTQFQALKAELALIQQSLMKD